MKHIRRGDMVMVIGGKEKGKKGKVLKIFPKDMRAVVEGLALIKKAVRPSQTNPQGGIITKEGTIHLSNLMLFCPKCGQPTRTGRKILSDGTKVRICTKCKEVV